MTTKSISSPSDVQDIYNPAGLDSPTVLRPQSGVVHYDEKTTEQQATVTFKDMADKTTTRIETKMSDRVRAQDSSVDFAKFFARPVKIADYQWNVGSPLDVEFDPWRLWFENPRISNRMNNFRGFAGSLHLKAVINGNPFYWGGAQLTYFPVAGAGIVPPWYNTDITYYGDLMSASQRMKIFIDPTLSQGGEMVLPFIWPADMLDLVDIGDYAQLGRCWLASLGPLRHASSSDALTVSIYAWCDDVHLASPTLADMPWLSAQSGKDEYSVGPIEKTSGIVSQLAGKLVDEPVIGPYAMASKAGADVVHAVANRMGLCKPRQVDNVANMRIQQAGEFACTDAFDNSQTLALTAKQEVTIDPAIAGVGPEDELDIRVFAGKESLTGFTDWNRSQLPNTFLYSVPVTPIQASVQVRTTLGGPTVSGVTMTPAGFLASNFQYWRGTMRIRIQVMSSAFHKGRLLLVWDPFAVGVVPEVQVQNTIVLDISKERDFVHDIKWGHPKPGLSTFNGPGPSLPIATTWRTTGSLATGGVVSNGVFAIYVLNKLTSSSTSSDPVRINVYTSFPDLELWAPRGSNQTYTPMTVLAPQSGEDPTTVESSSGLNVPGDVPTESVGGDTHLGAAAFMHGDPIVNMRALLKRFTLTETFTLFNNPANSTLTLVSVTRKIGVLWRGNQGAGGLHSGVNQIPCTLRQMMHSCFACFRGSMRYKLVPMTDRNTGGNAVAPYISVYRRPWAVYDTTIASQAVSNTAPNAEGDVNEFFADRDFSLGGIIFSSPPQGNVLEFQLPWYSSERFEQTYSRFNNVALSGGFTIESLGIWGGRNDFFYRMYSAVADDYNLFGFTGTPTLYLFSGP